MTKKHKRIHVTVNNKVASIYINEVYLPNGDRFQKFTDGLDTINTSYYEYLGICVGNKRRENNDWWNNDKCQLEKKYNKSTGSITTFTAITHVLEAHIDNFINTYGYYCCMFEPTDTRRRKTYMKMINYYCKKRNLINYYVIVDKDTFLYWIGKRGE